MFRLYIMFHLFSSRDCVFNSWSRVKSPIPCLKSPIDHLNSPTNMTKSPAQQRISPIIIMLSMGSYSGHLSFSQCPIVAPIFQIQNQHFLNDKLRSEERRVGKEC